MPCENKWQTGRYVWLYAPGASGALSFLRQSARLEEREGDSSACFWRALIPDPENPLLYTQLELVLQVGVVGTGLPATWLFRVTRTWFSSLGGCTYIAEQYIEETEQFDCRSIPDFDDLTTLSVCPEEPGTPNIGPLVKFRWGWPSKSPWDLP